MGPELAEIHYGAQLVRWRALGRSHEHEACDSCTCRGSCSVSVAPVVPAPPAPPVAGFDMSRFKEGQPVRCPGGRGARVEGGKLRHYPSQEIATSWDPNWQKSIMELSSCDGAPWGEVMSMKPATAAPVVAPVATPVATPVVPAPPAPPVAGFDMSRFKEGQPVRCPGGRGARVEGGKLRHYPSQEIATSWDPNWQKSIMELSSCDGAPWGEVMSMKPATAAPVVAPVATPVATPVVPAPPAPPVAGFDMSRFKEGQPVRCPGGRGARVEGGKLRHYPSQEIATSWDPNWQKSIMELSSCDGAPWGEVMSMKPATGAPVVAPVVSPGSCSSSTACATGRGL